jgi:hypothetical protein
VLEGGVETPFHGVQEGGGLVQLVGCGQCGAGAGELVAVVVVRAGAVGDVGAGELVEHLSQRPHPGQQVADHRVGVGGV